MSGIGGPITGGVGAQLIGTAYNFSRVPIETNIIYELTNNLQQVNQLTICRDSTYPGCSGIGASTNVVLRTPYIDMNNVNTSVCGSDLLKFSGNTAAWAPPALSPWNSTFTTGSDGSVAWGVGGGQDWQASWTPTLNESFILPLLNNSGEYMFQATTVSGATGSGSVTWPQTIGDTVVDGGVTWTNIGKPKPQGNGFTIFIYTPGNGCTLINTRVGKMYKSASNSNPGSYVQTTNDAVTCSRFGGTTPCTDASEYTMHDMSIAPGGRYVIVTPTGSEAANPPGKYNSGTLSGQISSAVWSGSVAGGSINGGVWSSGATYAAHAVVAYGSPAYFYTSLQAMNSGNTPSGVNLGVWWNLTEAYPLNFIYDTNPGSTLEQPCTDYVECGGHTAQGTVSKWFGSKYKQSYYTNGVVQGLLNPNTQLFQAPLPCDDHGTYRNSGSTDTTPIFTASTCVPMSSLTYTGAGYGEINAAPSTGEVGSTWTFYRYSHTFTGPNDFFDVQNNIGVVDAPGDLVAFGSDMWGRRGDQGSSNTTCSNFSGGIYSGAGTYSPGAGLTLLTTDPQNSNQPDVIATVNNNNGHFIYVTTTQGTGTTTSTQPTWCQVAGCTVTYTTTTGTNDILTAVANTCRGDVFIVDTLSSHSANNSVVTFPAPMFAGLFLKGIATQ